MLSKKTLTQINAAREEVAKALPRTRELNIAMTQIAQLQAIINHSKPLLEQINSMQPFWESINLVTNWIDENQAIFANINNFLANLHKQYGIVETEAIAILRKYKWFISPSMPTVLVFQIVKLDKNEGRQDKHVNKLFIDWFSSDNWENLEDMVTSWESEPLLKKRMKILKDCVNTLKQVEDKQINTANVILPTLISQIDGALTDYLNLKGLKWDVLYDDHVRKREVRVGRKSQFENHISQALPEKLDVLARDIFLNILLQGSQYDKPLTTPFNFNRHKIMHGENVRYGRKDYLIRAFMVLDFLAYLE